MKTNRILLAMIFVLFSLLAPLQKAQSQTPVCGYDASTAAILNQISEDSVASWIKNISGENTVLIAGVPRLITTRYSPALFNGNDKAQAFAYIIQELQEMGYTTQKDLSVHPYSYGSYHWKNIVLTIPGHGDHADQMVLLTAHLDSTSNNPNNLAPGAEDNGSGVSALMEAARLFRQYKFDYTIKIIFFTGEEQGLIGSLAYVRDYPSEMAKIIGVVNLDMFGYDGDNDRCIEMHVGELSASNTVGQCFIKMKNNYGLNFTYDYLTTDATDRSDHSSFWNANVGAIEILENFFSNSSSLGCGGRTDTSPHYHKTTDTIDKMSIPLTRTVVQAGVGTVSSLAKPMGLCFVNLPMPSLRQEGASSVLLE